MGSDVADKAFFLVDPIRILPAQILDGWRNVEGLEMNITKGPTLEKYATYFDIPLDEVLEWVNGYVNQPEVNCPDQPYEATEAERFTSIGGYIKRQVAGTANERIRMANAARKQEAA